MDSVLDIDERFLRRAGINLLLFDLDNTITRWNDNHVSKEIQLWFRRITSAGFRCCIISNNSEGRTIQVARQLQIDYIHRAQKPLRSGFRRALCQMHYPAAETLMIGDQLFTDIWGAKRSGLKTCLVRPMDTRREFLGTRINRLLESIILPVIRRRAKNT